MYDTHRGSNLRPGSRFAPECIFGYADKHDFYKIINYVTNQSASFILIDLFTHNPPLDIIFVLIEVRHYRPLQAW